MPGPLACTQSGGPNMDLISRPAGLAVCLTVAGCGLTHPAGSVVKVSSPPDGLPVVRPYPAPGDTCHVIGESDATRDFLDDAALLIGCPSHEAEAIADRQAEGASVVALQGTWTLLSLPLR